LKEQKSPSKKTKMAAAAFDILRSDILQPLVGSACAVFLTSSIEKLDITPELIKSPCFSLLISKVLGVGLIIGGSIVKLPQILKIVGAGSAKGISLVSYLLETLALSFSLAYNFRSGNPFSTYGESEYYSMIAISLFVLMVWV
jgi:mannose-P-dolichol utilization defect protein 1